jgi:ABC-type Fe3+-siderophore transport system permease subunit
MDITTQLSWLFLLAIPIACVAWTVTHEEVFREPREYCIKKSKNSLHLWQRKFFYLFTCEYCFSHYVTVIFLLLTDFQMLMTNWVGYVIAGFALVFVANAYMSLFALLRQAIKKEITEIAVLKKDTEKPELIIDKDK